MNDQSDEEKTSPLSDDDEANLESTRATPAPITRSGTLIVPAGSRPRRREDAAEGSPARLQGALVIRMVIRGMTEQISFVNRSVCTVGRSDLKRSVMPDVDLARYGANERGVSREHVRLEIKDDQLLVTDLGSTNGTFLRGERLAPYSPHVVHDGDELILARLAVQVIFGEQPAST